MSIPIVRKIHKAKKKDSSMIRFYDGPSEGVGEYTQKLIVLMQQVMRRQGL